MPPKNTMGMDMMYKSLLQFATMSAQQKALKEERDWQIERDDNNFEREMKLNELQLKYQLEKEKLKQKAQDKKDLASGVAAGTHTPLSLGRNGGKPDPTRNNANVFNYGGVPVRVGPKQTYDKEVPITIDGRVVGYGQRKSDGEFKATFYPNQPETSESKLERAKSIAEFKANLQKGIFDHRFKMESKYKETPQEMLARQKALKDYAFTIKQTGDNSVAEKNYKESRVTHLTKAYGTDNGMYGRIEIKNPKTKRTMVNNLFQQIKIEKNLGILGDGDINRVMTTVLNDLKYPVNEQIISAVNEALLVGDDAKDVMKVFDIAVKAYYPEYSQ